MPRTIFRTDPGSGQPWYTMVDNTGGTPLSMEVVGINTGGDTNAPVLWNSAALSDALSRSMVVPYVGSAQLLDDGSNLFRARGSTIGQYMIPRWDHLAVVATPTIDTAVYADPDRLGSVVTIANAAISNGRGGLITNPRLVDDAGSNFSIEAHFFKVTPTMANADNGVFDISDANIATALWIGKIDFQSALTSALTSNRITYGTVYGAVAPLGYVCDSAATSIFMICRARGAYDAAATDDLVFHFDLIRF
jgi:hypothetical protein